MVQEYWYVSFLNRISPYVNTVDFGTQSKLFDNCDKIPSFVLWTAAAWNRAAVQWNVTWFLFEVNKKKKIFSQTLVLFIAFVNNLQNYRDIKTWGMMYKKLVECVWQIYGTFADGDAA